MVSAGNDKEIKRIDFAEIGSTNEYAKLLRADGRDVVITADRQTGGRGTKGRSFSSDEGGVYVTKLSFYENFPARFAFKIMAGAAVAACETLEFYGLHPVIKWANDIYVHDKKICGILIENVFSGENVSSSIVGVGLNVCNKLPQELENIATTMAEVLECVPSVEKVREKLIERLIARLAENPSAEKNVEEYRKRVGYMHRRAIVIFGEKSVPATLLCVDEDGGLWTEIDGEKRRFAAAEVSLKL